MYTGLNLSLQLFNCNQSLLQNAATFYKLDHFHHHLYYNQPQHHRQNHHLKYHKHHICIYQLAVSLLCTHSSRGFLFLTTKQKGKVLLEDFNAIVGRSTIADNVIGIFGEETSNASGNNLISFHVRGCTLNKKELSIPWKGRCSLFIHCLG